MIVVEVSDLLRTHARAITTSPCRFCDCRWKAFAIYFRSPFGRNINIPPSCFPDRNLKTTFLNRHANVPLPTTLINIASVCRRWREVALSDPFLWSTLFLSLNPTDETLRRAIKTLDRCLERSKNIPFSCFITSGYDHFDESHNDLVIRLSAALFHHQKRWKDIQIHLPYNLIEESKENGDILFSLQAEDLGMLQTISVQGTWMYSMRGSHCLSSLTSLKLYLSNETDVKDWLLLSPNLEKLSVRAIQPEDDSWDAAGCPVKLEKLRYLKLDGPLSALQILSLISETFFFDVRSCTHFAFRVVLCRRYESTSLHHRSGMHHSPLTAATPTCSLRCSR